MYYAGGTKGFSPNPGEYRNSCLKQLRKMTEVSNTRPSQHDLTVYRIRKDEQAVK